MNTASLIFSLVRHRRLRADDRPDGTIYWIGAEEFRKTWVLNVGRGGMMPFIYGDLRLLNDSDRRFIAAMWGRLRGNAEVFADTDRSSASRTALRSTATRISRRTRVCVPQPIRRSSKKLSS